METTLRGVSAAILRSRHREIERRDLASVVLDTIQRATACNKATAAEASRETSTTFARYPRDTSP